VERTSAWHRALDANAVSACNGVRRTRRVLFDHAHLLPFSRLVPRTRSCSPRSTAFAVREGEAATPPLRTPGWQPSSAKTPPRPAPMLRTRRRFFSYGRTAETGVPAPSWPRALAVSCKSPWRTAAHAPFRPKCQRRPGTWPCSQMTGCAWDAIGVTGRTFAVPFPFAIASSFRPYALTLCCSQTCRTFAGSARPSDCLRSCHPP
jgi:hypothetical protein